MAQLDAITGNIKKRKQTDEMLARLGLLPDMLAQKEQRKFQEAQIQNMGIEQDLARQGLELENRQFGYQHKIDEKAGDLAEATAQRTMGVQAGGFGFNVLSGGIGKGVTLGSATDEATGLWGKMSSTPPATTPTPRTGGVWDMNLGAAAGGGLIGAGAGQILGGKNKVKKGMIGLGVGGLAGLLGGGNWSSALGGGLIGGLGSLI